MKSSLTIRQYQKKDHPQLVQAFETFCDYLAVIDPLKEIQRQAGYGELAVKETLADTRKKNGALYVAVIDKTVVGFIAVVVVKLTPLDQLSMVPTTIGRVTELYIHEEKRQQNIGTQLLQTAEQYLKNAGCKRILIEVFEPNIPARNFYTKHHYTERVRDLVKQIS
jgi:ribosomal protein S18 acetylase RimI-like enzyme